MIADFTEERARDALAFNPLHPAVWLNVSDQGITISVNYSERLSKLLCSLPNAKWDAAARVWRLPYSSSDELRRRFGEIDALAKAAKESAETETRRRQLERNDRERTRTNELERRNNERLAARPRAMKPEFITPTPGPQFALRLEAVGDNSTEFGMPQRNWVGQIIGLSANGRWARAYLNGARDYSHANSVGSRGIMVTYLLDPGLIYQVAEPRTWKRTDRWFCRVVEQEIVKMSEDEVRACLAR